MNSGLHMLSIRTTQSDERSMPSLLSATMLAIIVWSDQSMPSRALVGNTLLLRRRCTYSRSTFCGFASSTTKCYHPNQVLHLQQQHFDDSIQAGRDGYSVLRQPLQPDSWDPARDPSFEVPAVMADTDDDVVVDETWWQQQQGRQSKRETTLRWKTSPITTTTASSMPSSTILNKPDELDLRQRSYDTLDFDVVRRALHDACTTMSARALVRNATNVLAKLPFSTASYQQAGQPLMADTVAGAQSRYRAVQEMQQLVHHTVPAHYYYRDYSGQRQPMGGRPAPLSGQHDLDLPRVWQRVDAGLVLTPDQLHDMARLMQVMKSVTAWGQVLADEAALVELPQWASLVTVNDTLYDLLNTAFDADAADGTMRLSSATFPQLAQLRNEVRNLKQGILDQLDAILARPAIQKKLALEGGGPVTSQVQGGRLVIPVTMSAANSVGVIHDTSRSGQTAFCEPHELVAPTNELRSRENALRREEARIWKQLTTEVALNRHELEVSTLALGQLDLVHARCMLGNELAGVVPEVGDQGVIDLRNARHPVLLLRHVDAVGSDITLGADGNQGLVLTGPNAGGKTVILKLLGLLSLMARCGIPVPATAASPAHPARVDFFDPVLADIGDLQSVGGDLSTFSGHMLVCREVLRRSGQNALVLMDELGSGTDPAQGVAIAQAILEALVDAGCRVVITTHYMQLKQLAASDERFAVAGMEFVGNRPTYKLLPGTVGESFALSVAERLEMPQSIIDRATELLDSETRQMGDLIRELEDQKAIINQQALETDEKRKELARMEFKMKEQQIKLDTKLLTARRDEANKFAKKLEEKEHVLETILEKLKSDPSRKVIAKSWDDIQFAKRDALNEAENIPSVLARKQRHSQAAQEANAELVPLSQLRDAPELNEGDTLLICKNGPLQGRRGIITKSMGKRVEVRINNMNVAFNLSEVALPTDSSSSPLQSLSVNGSGNSITRGAERAMATEARSATKAKRLTTSNDASTAPSSSGIAMRTHSNTVDVRGLTLTEAQEQIKTKFSASLMAKRPVVYVLHGIGTSGVLRDKIRGWLRTERQLVKRFAAADQSDGGDAFTRVELR